MKEAPLQKRERKRTNRGRAHGQGHSLEELCWNDRTCATRPIVEDSLVASILGIFREEKRLGRTISIGTGVVGWRGLVRDLADVGGVGARTSLGEVALTLGIRRVEIGLGVGNRQDSVLGRGAAGPVGAPVAPVIDDEGAGAVGNGIGQVAQPRTVGVEGDASGRPVEAVLVESFVRLEGELVQIEAGSLRGVKAIGG